MSEWILPVYELDLSGVTLVNFWTILELPKLKKIIVDEKVLSYKILS